MSTRHVRRIVLLVIFCVPAGGCVFAPYGSRSHAFRSRCLPGDGTEYNLRMGLLSAMNRTDPMSDNVIAARGVVRVSPAEVVAVTDTMTCRRAADAYGAAINVPNGTRLVHAVRVGIRYVVLDPNADRAAGGWMTGIAFDSTFTQVYTKFAF